eukprot:gb/GECG01005983.1/.p1 GENE.gb/GECG01005983.1/~~gb/GECG01005983.1/.p1  ORF type:complete len:272 (+),score=34.35 gb/GECG01005983.1/:1-816(+)
MDYRSFQHRVMSEDNKNRGFEQVEARSRHEGKSTGRILVSQYFDRTRDFLDDHFRVIRSGCFVTFLVCGSIWLSRTSPVRRYTAPAQLPESFFGGKKQLIGKALRVELPNKNQASKTNIQKDAKGIEASVDPPTQAAEEKLDVVLQILHFPKLRQWKTSITKGKKRIEAKQLQNKSIPMKLYGIKVLKPYVDPEDVKHYMESIVVQNGEWVYGTPLWVTGPNGTDTITCRLEIKEGAVWRRRRSIAAMIVQQGYAILDEEEDLTGERASTE